jgi:hypothetical protein
MSDDTVLATSGDWQISTDNIQWIVRKRRSMKGADVWQGISFVHTTSDIMARCLKEKGCPPEDAAKLLAAISARFADQKVAEPIPEQINACI